MCFFRTINLQPVVEFETNMKRRTTSSFVSAAIQQCWVTTLQRIRISPNQEIPHHILWKTLEAVTILRLLSICRLLSVYLLLLHRLLLLQKQGPLLSALTLFETTRDKGLTSTLSENTSESWEIWKSGNTSSKISFWSCKFKNCNKN